VDLVSDGSSGYIGPYLAFAISRLLERSTMGSALALFAIDLREGQVLVQ